MTLYFSWGGSLFLEDFVPSHAAMVRESGIAATKPVFPSYLLPSLEWISFPRLRSALPSLASRHEDEVSSSSSISSSFLTTTPPADDDGGPAAKSCGDDDNDVPSTRLKRLSCTAADTIKCSSCSADLAFSSQIISKGFTGRHGRAFLVAPSGPGGGSLLNIRLGRNENRQLVTGWHTVADISCDICTRKLGWKYVDAEEDSQQYKVGKFILETERVVTYRSWGDVPEGAEDMHDGWDDDGETEGHGEGEFEFDSEDEDECDDIFAGVWDAVTAAERRNRRLGWGTKR